MNVVEVYLKEGISIDAVAEKVARALGVVFEARHGLNRGGRYYQATHLGCVLELLCNSREVRIPERPDWPYYIIVSEVTASSGSTAIFDYANDIVASLQQHGITSEIDSLS